MELHKTITLTAGKKKSIAYINADFQDDKSLQPIIKVTVVGNIFPFLNEKTQLQITQAIKVVPIDE